MVTRFLRRRQAPEAARSLLRAALIEALQSPACALCQIAQRNNPRYVETLLDEAVVDVEQRDDWRAARGLCGWHAWMAAQTPQGAGSLRSAASRTACEPGWIRGNPDRRARPAASGWSRNACTSRCC